MDKFMIGDIVDQHNVILDQTGTEPLSTEANWISVQLN